MDHSSPFVEQPGSESNSPKMSAEPVRDPVALEFEIKKLQHLNSKQKIDYDTTILHLTTQHKDTLAKLEDSLADTRFLSEKNSELEARIDKILKEKNEFQRAKQTEVSALEEELLVQKELVSRLQVEQGSSRVDTETRISALEQELAQMESVSNQYELQLEASQQQIEELQCKLRENDDKLEIVKASKMMSVQHEEEDHEAEILRKELSHQLNYIKELEKANLSQADKIKQLEHNKENVVFLQEENRGLLSKLKRLENLETKMATMEIEKLEQEQTLQKWELYVGDSVRVEEVLGELQQKRQQAIVLQDEANKARSDSDSLRRQNSEMAVERAQLLDLTSSYETSIVNLKKLNYELEQQLRLSFEECRLLREFNEEGAQENGTNLVEEYKNKTRDLTDELSRLNTELQSQTKRRKHDDLASNYSSRLNELMVENTQLAAQLKNTKQDLALLQEKQEIAKQHEKKIRILELRSNPVSRDQFVKKQMLDSLKQENDDLVSQLQGDSTVEKLPKSVVTRYQHEISNIEKQLLDANKAHSRLRQVFNAKSMEFIEVAHTVLGYKLEFLPGNKVKLTSQKYSTIIDLSTQQMETTVPRELWDPLVEKGLKWPLLFSELQLKLAHAKDL